MCNMLHIRDVLGRIRWGRAELALIGITIVWGATFLIVHLTLEHTGPWFFVGIRFLTAGLLSAIVFHRVLRGLRWKEFAAGSAIGVTIYLGYGLQTVGLQTIDSSTSAFLTALYVPLVPLLQWLVFRKAPTRMALLGIALAFIGLILLTDPSSVGLHWSTGEILTLLSTVPIAAEIVLIGLFAKRVNVGRVTVIQLLVAGILGFLTMPIVGEQAPAFSWAWLASALALGAASCLIQLTMNWAQRSVSPTRATIIYAGEPVWAGIIGRIAGDRLPPIAILGAALIVIGSLVSELRPRSAPDAEHPTDTTPHDGDTRYAEPADTHAPSPGAR